MSAFTAPIIITGNDALSLERISLSANNSDSFSEKWLQNIVFENPGCLPVKEIDPHIGDLIPICTEIETGAGPADILFVTPTGQLILVETKLWRNPEARREVVAQILDYAKQLTSWTYEDLVRESAVATKQGQDYFSGCLSKYGVDESAFVDGVNRSLSTGDFLLLIVGDGIRSGAKSLVGFIEQYGNLRFGMGLIEVAAFKLPDESILLQPRILAKTEILKRTVIVGSGGSVEVEDIANSEDGERKNSDHAWFQAFWSEYLAKLSLDDPLQPFPDKPAKSTNMFFTMPPGASFAWISAYIAQSSGTAGVYLTFAKALNEKIDFYYEQLLSQQEDIERGLPVRLDWHRSGNKIYISVPNILFDDLNLIDQREKVQIYLAEMTNHMVNAFRHRLDAISQQVE